MKKSLDQLGHSSQILEDGQQVDELLNSGDFPSMIILDWEMPGKSGPELCRKIKALQEETGRFNYVILCTTRDSKEDRITGFNEGADDYICKPFDQAELKARIQVGYRTLNYQKLLEEKEFNIRVSCYQALTELAETHCLETGSHLRRVALLGSSLAEWAGMDANFIRDIKLFAPMHDIGKVGVPESLLYLPRSLTKEEFQLVQNHTLHGWKILRGKPTLEMAADIALTHHERWDGTGYPQNIEGNNIPLAGRITAICDVYDTLRSKRSYKDNWGHSESLSFLNEQKGLAFDPLLVDLVKEHSMDWEKLYTSEKHHQEKLTLKDLI